VTPLGGNTILFTKPYLEKMSFISSSVVLAGKFLTNIMFLLLLITVYKTKIIDLLILQQIYNTTMIAKC